MQKVQKLAMPLMMILLLLVVVQDVVVDQGWRIMVMMVTVLFLKGGLCAAKLHVMIVISSCAAGHGRRGRVREGEGTVTRRSQQTADEMR